MVTGAKVGTPLTICFCMRCVPSVVQHIHGRHGGQEHDRADAPDIESADIVFAARVVAGEWGRNFAAVAGENARQQVHADDVPFLETAAEVFGVEGRLDRVHVAAQDAAGERRSEIKNDFPPVGVMGWLTVL